VGAAGLEVLMTQEYLPSFKLMIGGSDYHLFSRENTLGDQMLGNKVVHQYIRKASQVIRGSIKRSVPTQQSSASPDIIHIAQEDVNLADMMIDVADVKNGLPTYLKQTESVKKKKVNKVDTDIQQRQEITATPVFHLYNHTLELFDQSNLISHDKKRRAKNASALIQSNGFDGEDKLEKINLLSSVIKKEGDPG